jgi:hypothetical protein
VQKQCGWRSLALRAGVHGRQISFLFSASILCPAAEAAEFNLIATMEKKNGLLAIYGPKSEWICTEKLAC